MLTLTSDNVIVKADENIILKLVYPVDIGGDEAILFERGFGGDSAVVSKVAKDPSGQVTFTIKSSIQGEHTYWAVVTPCWVVLNCDYSNDVKISITEGQCGEWDLLCRLAPQLDTKIIMAIVVIVVLLAIFIFYVPKGRK